MAKKTVLVSDLTGKEIGNDRDAVKITVTSGMRGAVSTSLMRTRTTRR